MQVQFYKYQATGNDFIMIDNREQFFPKDLSLISRLCHRKFGIGSDGLILIENHSELDFNMIFYNPDGSQSLCGNGSRCAVNFAKFLGIITDRTSFMAYDGLHTAEITDGIVKLRMSDVQNVMSLEDGMFVDTGSPHLIRFVKGIEQCAVVEQGKILRDHKINGDSGVNVNFVEILGESEISVRTYERGVENETLSCGTGVTAAALSAAAKKVSSPVSIRTKGGELQVCFSKKEDGRYTDIHLIGPAVHVFEGTLPLPSDKARK